MSPRFDEKAAQGDVDTLVAYRALKDILAQQPARPMNVAQWFLLKQWAKKDYDSFLETVRL